MDLTIRKTVIPLWKIINKHYEKDFNSDFCVYAVCGSAFCAGKQGVYQTVWGLLR